MTAPKIAALDPELTASGTGTTPGREERLPLRTLVAYGLPSVALSMMGTFVIMNLLFFTTETLMVSTAVFGVAFAVSRLWDGVSDPLVGFLSDGTRSKMGRRRPWIAWGAVPLALVFLALWSPPPLEGTALTIWMVVAIIAFYTAFTVINIPHMAWGAELSPNYQERNRVFGSRAIFNALGSMLAAGAMWLLESTEDKRSMATIIALAAGFMAVTLMVLCTTWLRERPEFQGRGGSRPDSALLDVFKNRYARLLLTVFFLDSLGFGCLIVLFPYMTKYSMGEGASAGLFVGVTMLVALGTFPLWFWLSRRFGKRNPWIAANFMKVGVFAMLYFVDPSQTWLIWISIVLMGAAQPAGMILAPSIKADVVDYDEYCTGQRKEGTYFATFNFAEKLANGLAISVAAIGLELIGYKPNVEQTADAIGGLRILFAGLPFVLHAVGIVVLFRFDFNADEHARVRRELEARPENRLPTEPGTGLQEAEIVANTPNASS